MIQLNPRYEAIFNPRNIDEDCNKIADEINDVVRIQIKEINSLNNPTNADSLAKPLEDAGYPLSQSDKDALKARNTFLHGGLAKGTIEKQTNDVFYLSLMLHELACIIILKRAGFNGYILNNPMLYNCEKAVQAGEKALLMI